MLLFCFFLISEALFPLSTVSHLLNRKLWECYIFFKYFYWPSQNVKHTPLYPFSGQREVRLFVTHLGEWPIREGSEFFTLFSLLTASSCPSLVSVAAVVWALQCPSSHLGPLPVTLSKLGRLFLLVPLEQVSAPGSTTCPERCRCILGCRPPRGIFCIKSHLNPSWLLGTGVNCNWWDWGGVNYWVLILVIELPDYPVKGLMLCSQWFVGLDARMLSSASHKKKVLWAEFKAAYLFSFWKSEWQQLWNILQGFCPSLYSVF